MCACESGIRMLVILPKCLDLQHTCLSLQNVWRISVEFMNAKLGECNEDDAKTYLRATGMIYVVSEVIDLMLLRCGCLIRSVL